MKQVKERKIVVIDGIIEAIGLPQTGEIVLQLNKLDLKTLELLSRGISALQMKKLSDYNAQPNKE